MKIFNAEKIKELDNYFKHKYNPKNKNKPFFKK